uniref:Uncharacterized protein n=1 Tax=Labrus bergylta TaxID=56723 RepID=A0A3Q3GBI4_9LABR
DYPARINEILPFWSSAIFFKNFVTIVLEYRFLITSPLQALLHPYFFSSPLPAHHSELPIPQRCGRLPRQHLQAPATDFSLDLPLQNSVLDPFVFFSLCLFPFLPFF